MKIANLHEVVVLTAGKEPYAGNIVVYPYAPTASAIVVQFMVPFACYVDATVFVATASAKGTSADVLDTVSLKDGGYAGAGTTVKSNALTLLGAADTITRTAGWSGRLKHLATQGPYAKGSNVQLYWTEAGTVGDATRPTITVAFKLRKVAPSADI